MNRKSIKEKWDAKLKSIPDYGVEKKNNLKEKYEKTLSITLYLGMN